MEASSIARVVHEANRALQQEQGDPTIAISPNWNNTDTETQNSAIEGVQGVIDGNTPEESHEQWVKFKLNNGWKLGQEKNVVKKEHPLLLPYYLLPQEQKLKDELFCAIVKVLS